MREADTLVTQVGRSGPSAWALIRAGQPVARAGNTGISRGPHLHMEWRAGGRVVDPMRRFPRAHLPGWMVREFEGEEALVRLRAGRP